MKISVVIPVYGCPEALRPLHDRLKQTLKQIRGSHEIILVNDGCPKGSWRIIEEICKEDKDTVGINLSRNFGQIHATNAGIDHANGDYIVLMDCDLQDRPEAIIDLYREIEKGYDIVFAKRKDRKESFLTLFLSDLFYKVYNALSDVYYDKEIGNFCIVRKPVVDEYRKIKDNNRSFTTVLSWMGYDTAYLEIEAEERFEGKSSYTFAKKMDMAVDLLTSNSNKPLKVIVHLGFLIAFLSFLYLFIQVIRYFVVDDILEGWTSVIAAIFLVGGIVLISIGGVGLYVGNIFNQTKGLPDYLIMETLNGKK